eukprot:NODE_2021_length_2310_cov_7.443426.p1 GENE.NODE_2021_length_2310_cov_7.443426~~NODE_2021_length_2310_cov_7.443426.p1  ORF type:complete len:687 (-),score=228.67 NODE_2021_length_2310_cov_7.443426:113-2173(-)
MATSPNRCDESTRHSRLRVVVGVPRVEEIPDFVASPVNYDTDYAYDMEEAGSAPASPRLVQGLMLESEVSSELFMARRVIHERLKNLPRIPELDYQPTSRYTEASIEEVLHPLIANSDAVLVAGGFFGDEGKGKTVDGIARHPDVKVVARVNSGENAGHTVVSEAGVKYDFHLCPSGLLTPGKVNVIGPECVMDPISFMEREISQLTRDGIPYKDRLFVGNVHIVCPHHKLLDLMSSWRAPNASTIQGMAPVHASKARRRGLRMDHLMNDHAAARRQLEADLFEYWGALKNLGISEATLLEKACANRKVQKHVRDFIEAKDKAGYTLDLLDRYVLQNPAFPEFRDVSHLLRETVRQGGKVLVEGPQSYWLSNAAEKYWECGTSAHTCAAGMLAASRLNMSSVRSVVINIHKTPGSSRVGSGANPVAFVPQDYFSKIETTMDDMKSLNFDWREVSNRFFKAVQPNGIVEPQVYENSTGRYDLGVAMACATCIHPSHGEFGVTSGRPRVVGFFDCVAQAEAMAAQGPYCSISALDRGDDYDEYGVCIAYVFQHPEGKSLKSNGRTYESGTLIRPGDALPTQAVLQHCHAIIKKVRGWRETPIFARSEWWLNRKGPIVLPEPVCEVLDIIEHFSGSRIISIGNGQKGSDIIYIKRVEAGSAAEPEAAKPVEGTEPAESAESPTKKAKTA